MTVFYILQLYFITCLQQVYPRHYKDTKYNLCCIDFNPEDGTFGNHVDTLFNAVAMGKSLTWPKPSYDGKYMLFTLTDYDLRGELICSPLFGLYKVSKLATDPICTSSVLEVCS